MRSDNNNCVKIVVVVVIIQLIVLVAMLTGSARQPHARHELIVNNEAQQQQQQNQQQSQQPTCPPTELGPVLEPGFTSPAQSKWPIDSITLPTKFWLCTREGEVLSKQVALNHCYAPRESLVFHHILSNLESGCKSVPGGKWVVDVGAQLGYFSMLSAAMGCRVLSVEPQPHWYPNFLISRRMNGFDNRITLYKGAATSVHKGRVPIGFDYFIGGAYGLSSAHGENQLEVDTFRLDEILKENKIDNILLLKIDVEGYEMEVLNGMTNYLGKVENYVMEIKLGNNIHVPDTEKIRWVQETCAKNNYNAFQFVEDYNFNHGAAESIVWDPYVNYFQKFNGIAMPASEDFWITGDKKMNEVFT